MEKCCHWIIFLRDKLLSQCMLLGLSLEIDFSQKAERGEKDCNRNQKRTLFFFLAHHNYISIMQMSLVLVVRGLLECVIENAKDCLASKCRGMRWLAANQNGPHVPRTRNRCLNLSRIESFYLN